MNGYQMFVVRFFFIFVLSVTIVGTGFAQSSESTLVGSIAVKDGAGYVYKLQFKDSAGIIKGYSITDVGGPNETRSAITGTINASRKEISFKETKLLKTKSTVTRDSFCYVHGKLKLKGSKAMKGSFTGYMPDGKTKCATGDIVLYSTADILGKLMKMGITIDSAALKKMDTAMINNGRIFKMPEVVQLSSGKPLEVLGNSSSATLELWDDKHIDGDIVTVKHNSKVVLEKYRLAATKKKLNIKLTGNADTIALIAQNEGSEPPNTAMLKLVSGNFIHFLNASTKINEPAYIIIKPKAP